MTRLLLMLVFLFATATLLACGDDGDDAGGPSQGSQSEVCDDFQVVQEDLDELRQQILRGDFDAAQDSLDDARTHVADLRDSVRDAPDNDAAAQSAADLVGAVEGLETTFRQVGQGGGSVQGVLQELQIQLVAIATSLNSLRDELRCS